MDERTKHIYSEILEKCRAENCIEFECYWEMWGLMWYPWFIEIDNKFVSFSFNDLCEKDLSILCSAGLIEITKVYSQEELDDEIDRKRYRLKE